jgi:hypothetical protein
LRPSVGLDGDARAARTDHERDRDACAMPDEAGGATKDVATNLGELDARRRMDET